MPEWHHRIMGDHLEEHNKTAVKYSKLPQSKREEMCYEEINWLRTYLGNLSTDKYSTKNIEKIFFDISEQIARKYTLDIKMRFR